MLEAIFLYVILHDDNSNGERFRTQMPSMEVCREAVKESKMTAPHSTSGDYEAMGVMFCGTGTFHRHYGAAWHNDKVRNPEK